MDPLKGLTCPIHSSQDPRPQSEVNLRIFKIWILKVNLVLETEGWSFLTLMIFLDIIGNYLIVFIHIQESLKKRKYLKVQYQIIVC